MSTDTSIPRTRTGGRTIRPSRACLRRAIERLASPELTLGVIVTLAIGVGIAYVREGSTTWPLVGPLLAFAVNLGAAVAINPVFRRQSALLIFHLALIVVVLLVAAGRLTYLKGHVELTEGESFTGRLVAHESGPLHRWRLDRVAFTNLGFSIDYAPGWKRGRTVNELAYRDAAGRELRAHIGDNVPLVLQGYRFYTSFNKGYAPVFTWAPVSGEAQRGSVHLPSYPMHEYRQAQEWTPPGTTLTVWTQLQFDEVVLDETAATQFRKPAVHQLIVRIGEAREELAPGGRVVLAQGVLTYHGLSTWMGYTVYHDWTLPWLLAAALTAVASLAWHFAVKFARSPW